MSNKLGVVAEARALAGRGILAAGNCQAWVRECYEQVYGGKFEAHHKGSAARAAKSWLGTPYAVAPSRGSVVGDILYHYGTPGNPNGHVGIRIKGNRVAENSTRGQGRIRGGIGIVSLETFGEPDLIVRLP